MLFFVLRVFCRSRGSIRVFFFFSSRRRHTRWTGDWSSDVCSSDLQTWLDGVGPRGLQVGADLTLAVSSAAAVVVQPRLLIATAATDVQDHGSGGGGDQQPGLYYHSGSLESDWRRLCGPWVAALWTGRRWPAAQ